MSSFKKMFKLLMLLLAFAINGCGDGNSETNGSLSLTAAAPVNSGLANLVATASLTPVLTGAKISFTATQYGSNNGNVETVEVYQNNVNTDITGKAVMAHNFVQQQFDTTIQVTAVSQGLLAAPVSIVVPKLVP
jgi:hypothetical protein